MADKSSVGCVLVLALVLACLGALPTSADPLSKCGQNLQDPQFIQNTLEYDSAVRKYGRNSFEAFELLRSMAKYCIDHKRFDEARPILVRLVDYAKDPKNYFDSGAEWDERRRKGIPEEGYEKMTIDGKEYNVPFIGNRRPSAVLNRGDLVRYLYVLYCVNTMLGASKLADDALDESKENYSKYQAEIPDYKSMSFAAFIAKYSTNKVIGAEELKKLLQ